MELKVNLHRSPKILTWQRRSSTSKQTNQSEGCDSCTDTRGNTTEDHDPVVSK